MVTSKIIKDNHPEFRSRNILFPADVFGAGEEDQTDEVQRKYIYDALGRYLEYFEEDENIYRQFSVALMWKHTIRVLAELLGPIPGYIYKHGRALDKDPEWGPVVSGAIEDQLFNTIEAINAMWPRADPDHLGVVVSSKWEKWPVNFMVQPNAFPYRITNQLGTYAATHMESVQKGVLQITRAVKQFQRERGPPPPLEVEMPDDVPEGKEENPPANALVAQLKESLLKAIREELPARFVPPPPLLLYRSRSR